MYTLKMYFKTSENKIFLLNIKNCKRTLNSSKITSAMNQLIQTNVIKTTKGDLVEIEKADIVLTESQSYIIP